MPRFSKKNVYGRFFSKALDRCTSESSSQDSDEYVQEGTKRAMALSLISAEFSPPLTDAELEAIALPGELTSEEYQRNRDNVAAKTIFTAKKDETRSLIEKSEETINEARDSGVDLSKFLKKPKTRGQDVLYTKIDKQGRRVVLEWDPTGHPIGPGAWASKFNKAIGCLVRNKDIWDVALTFNNNSYSSFKNTWMELLRSFVLENDMDMHWKYVREKMHDSFRQYRDRLKMKYLKPPFEEHWQRIYGVPSTVPIESFAYLLLYWESSKAQDESARNSANRLRKEDQYYGGSVSIYTWRYNVAAAGGDASLSNTWQVLHTTEGMPAEIQDTQRSHYENLYAGEQLFREENPEYPVDNTILPLGAESEIMQNRFPKAAAKGRVPLIGTLKTLKRGRPSYSSGYNYSQDQEQIKDLQEALQSQTQKVDSQDQKIEQLMQLHHQQQQLIERMQSQFSSQQQTPYYQHPAQGLQPSPPPPQPSQERQINVSAEQYEEFQRFAASRRVGG